MSRLNTKIDKKDLYNDLQSAIEYDKRYWIRNDAKLRAVVSSKSYEEFCDVVAAAHLTSLNRKEITSTAKSYTWNTLVRKPSEQ